MDEFLNGKRAGTIVVAKLPADIQAHLGAKSSRVLLSAETVRTHRHHKWVSADFNHLQNILDRDEVRDTGEFYVVAVHRDGVWRQVALKATRDKKEVYLTTLHIMRESALAHRPNGNYNAS